MRSDASAYLIYGIGLPKDFIFELSVKMGVKVEEADWLKWFVYKKTGIDILKSDSLANSLGMDYWANKGRLYREYAIDIDYFGYRKTAILNRKYFAYIESFVSYASEISEIDMNTLSVEPTRVEKFKDFCEIMEIEYFDPKWYLCTLFVD